MTTADVGAPNRTGASSARPERCLISVEPIAAGASPRMIRLPSTFTLLDPASGWAAIATGSGVAAVLGKVAVKIAAVSARQAVSAVERVIRMGGTSGAVKACAPNVTHKHLFCIARE